MLPRHCARTLRGHVGPVNDVQFNANGNYCLSCGQDGTLRLWNPHRPGLEGSGSGGLLVKTFAGTHHKGALGATIARDNAKFASCGNDSTALLWDVASGKVLRKFWEHTGRVNCVAFNNARGSSGKGPAGGMPAAEESVLVTGCYDTLVRVFDLRSRNPRPIQTLAGGRDSITSLVITGHQIIASDVHGVVNYYDIRKACRMSDQLVAPVASISLSNDGNCLLASCLDSSLHLVEAATGEHMMAYKGHTARSFSIRCCFASSDAFVFCGSEDSKVYAWDLVEGKVAARLSGHSAAVTAVSHHPSKPGCIVSSSHDGTVKLWQKDPPAADPQYDWRL